MGRLKERITWAWARENVDALVVLVLGFVLAILGLLQVVKGDALTAATLGVLAVLAFTVLRERPLGRASLAPVRKFGRCWKEKS